MFTCFLFIFMLVYTHTIEKVIFNNLNSKDKDLGYVKLCCVKLG